MRKVNGSAPAFAASSSMKDSLAKLLEKPPRLRNADERRKVYVNGAVAVSLPPALFPRNCDRVFRHPVVRECVVHGLVARAAPHRGTERGRQQAGLLAGEEIPARLGRRAGVVGRRPDGVIPGGDAALGVQAALHRVEHRGAERLPAVLVLPHPLHADGLAHRLREQGGIRRRVVRAVVPVAARRLDVDDVDGGGRQVQQLGDRSLQRVDSLCAGPDRCLDARCRVGRAAYVRDAARRPDSGMHLEGVK